MEGVEIAVKPERARRGEAVAVIVYGLEGYNLTSLLMQVVAGKNAAIMLPPRRLGTYASPRQVRADVYDSVIETASYEPGEYIVDVSGSERFEARHTASKRFTVVASRPMARGAGLAGRRRP